MTDRAIFERFGYDPDDPVPRDDEGQRIIPDRLLQILAQADMSLTEGELEVLYCMSRGMSITKTALLLPRGERAVERLRESASMKLNAASTAHACCEAIRRGLIP